MPNDLFFCEADGSSLLNHDGKACDGFGPEDQDFDEEDFFSLDLEEQMDYLLEGGYVGETQDSGDYL